MLWSWYCWNVLQVYSVGFGVNCMLDCFGLLCILLMLTAGLMLLHYNGSPHGCKFAACCIMNGWNWCLLSIVFFHDAVVVIVCAGLMMHCLFVEVLEGITLDLWVMVFSSLWWLLHCVGCCVEFLLMFNVVAAMSMRCCIWCMLDCSLLELFAQAWYYVDETRGWCE